MTFEKWWEDEASKSISASLNAALRSIAAAAWGAGVNEATQPEWQPIETLPFVEDVLVWLYENGRICLGCRTRDDEEGWLWSRAYSAPTWPAGRIADWWIDDTGLEDLHPTLWMPLPELPNE